MISIGHLVGGAGRAVLTKQSGACALFSPFVRWRKRRWAPKAASKEFYVRQKPPDNPEEYAELIERFRPYRTYMKSLRGHLRKELGSRRAVAESHDFRDYEEQLYQDLMKINEKWNEETGIIREQRELRDTTEEQEKNLELTTLLDQKKERLKEEADTRVIQEQEASVNFITTENLEQEIIKALNKTVNYNFAIDLEGNRYVEKADFTTELQTDHTDTKPFVLSESSQPQDESQETVSN